MSEEVSTERREALYFKENTSLLSIITEIFGHEVHRVKLKNSTIYGRKPCLFIGLAR